MLTRIVSLALLLMAYPFASWAADCDSNPAIGNGPLARGYNYGYYVWSETAHAWILQHQYRQAFADAEAFKAGDVPIAGSAFPPISSGMHAPTDGPVTPNTSICDPPPVELPTMTVTAPRPSTGVGGMIIYRGGSYTVANNGGGFGRAQANVGVKQADPTLTCQNSDDDARMFAALDKLKGTPARGVYLIMYSPHTYQLWAVTNPTFSDKGLQPVGRCVSTGPGS